MRLDQQVALITGGASGIGLATARIFAEEGADVAIADVRQDAAGAAAEQIRALGRRSIAIEVNVTNPEAVQAMVDRTVAELGRLDILVACAGIGRTGPFLTHRIDAWQKVLDVNLSGVFYCGQAAARVMAEQGSGRIINIASINGFRGIEGLVGYNASKAGVISLTQTMAVELARHGITVNAIAPAQIETPLLATLPEAARQLRRTRIPMDRFGQPEEIARAALFLASADAGFVTGHTLAVDGGYLAGGTWTRPNS